MRPALFIATLALLAGFAVRVGAQDDVVRPAIAPGTGGAEQLLRGVGVDERYETALPLETAFRTHEGTEVRLADLWRTDRPALIQFVYYSCATVCDTGLTSLARSLQGIPWTVGTEFDVYTISIDPRDTPEVAADARGRVLGRYGRAEAERGWHFLVGSAGAVAALTDAVGYRFEWDRAGEQFAHPAVLLVTRAGTTVRMSRYLGGLEYSATDLRLSLAEAADGRTLGMVESAFLYCFRYDAHEGRYVLVAWRIMRIGGALAALALVAVLVAFWRRELRPRTPHESTV